MNITKSSFLFVAIMAASFEQTSATVAMPFSNIPQVSTIDQLSEDADVKANLSSVHFYLHTNDNPSQPDELFVDDLESLQNSHFQVGGPLWVLVHGYGANIDGIFPQETGLDLLATNPAGNVILLDWAELAAGPNYVRAVKNGYAVSNFTAELLKFLMRERVVRSVDIHLIGFSLGGQVVGIIGKRFEGLTAEKVGWVTGLDPAWPLFALAEPDDKISSDDAHFVDIIHTNGGTMGVIQPCGHIDFYPNGGLKQPGCRIDIFGACSHARAVYYFKESITSATPFRSCKCLSWEEFGSGNCACPETANLGYYVDQSARGSFYLHTNKKTPFAQG